MNFLDEIRKAMRSLPPIEKKPLPPLKPSQHEICTVEDPEIIQLYALWSQVDKSTTTGLIEEAILEREKVALQALLWISILRAYGDRIPNDVDITNLRLRQDFILYWERKKNKESGVSITKIPSLFTT